MNVLAKWLCCSCSGTTSEFRNVTVCFVSNGRRVSSQVAFEWRVSVHIQPKISVCTVTKTFKKLVFGQAGIQSVSPHSPRWCANSQYGADVTIPPGGRCSSYQVFARWWLRWKGTRRSLVSGCQKLSYIDSHCNCSPTFEKNLHKQQMNWNVKIKTRQIKREDRAVFHRLHLNSEVKPRWTTAK